MADHCIQHGERLAKVEQGIEEIRRTVVRIEDKMEHHYVTRIEFDPVKRLVYGVVGLVLAAVATGLIGIVVVQ